MVEQPEDQEHFEKITPSWVTAVPSPMEISQD
jgi:hypothetical protein